MTESVPSFSLRLIGYSNNLAGRSDFNRFWNYAAAEFGSDQFYFALQGEETMERAIAFDSEQAVEVLEVCGFGMRRQLIESPRNCRIPSVFG